MREKSRKATGLFSLLSDGASGHFKNSLNMLNLVNHKIDFDLDACWTFTATGHGKGAGVGIGAVFKSTARRVTWASNMLLSTPRDFYKFSQQQQLKTVEAKDQPEPGVHVLFLEAEEGDQAKEDILEPRAEIIKGTGDKYLFLWKHTWKDFCLGTIPLIRTMHEFQPNGDVSITCRPTSRASRSNTTYFQ